MAIGFFAVFDDIAVLLDDDVAMMSKVAAKKTAGVLGNDLAVGLIKHLVFLPAESCLYYGQLQKVYCVINLSSCRLLFF